MCKNNTQLPREQRHKMRLLTPEKHYNIKVSYIIGLKIMTNMENGYVLVYELKSQILKKENTDKMNNCSGTGSWKISKDELVNDSDTQSILIIELSTTRLSICQCPGCITKKSKRRQRRR